MVFHVQRQLAPYASVAESELMTDRATGEPREVDIVVRSRVGEHEIVVSVECLEHSRKATVSWIEQMITKHQALPTHKLVLVSASGFTVPAIAKATALGIEVLSLDSADTFDWTSIVGKAASLPITWFEYHLHGVTLVMELNDRPIELPFGPNTQLLSAAGEPKTTLGDIVHPLLQSWEKFGERAAQQLPQDGETQFGVELRPRDVNFVSDAAGNLHPVSAIRAYVSGHAITMPVALKSAAWRGTPIAYGSGPSPLGDISVTVVEPMGAPIGGVATVASPSTGNPEAVTLEPQPASSSFHFVVQGGPLGFACSKPNEPRPKPKRNRTDRSAT
jgi:hypothetical protein